MSGGKYLTPATVVWPNLPEGNVDDVQLGRGITEAFTSDLQAKYVEAWQKLMEDEVNNALFDDLPVTLRNAVFFWDKYWR